jgi:hypothetical protein
LGSSCASEEPEELSVEAEWRSGTEEEAGAADDEDDDEDDDALVVAVLDETSAERFSNSSGDCCFKSQVSKRFKPTFAQENNERTIPKFLA